MFLKGTLMCLSGLLFRLQQQEKCAGDREDAGRGCFVGAIYQAAKFLAQMSRGKMRPERGPASACRLVGLMSLVCFSLFMLPLFPFFFICCTSSHLGWQHVLIIHHHLPVPTCGSPCLLQRSLIAVACV